MAREVATAYTGANVSLTIGSTLLTNAFGISYEVTQNKRPIYGYNSMHYNAVARGQVLVLGQLYINFQHPSYLSKVLNQYYLEYSRNRSRFDSTIRTKDVDILSVGRSIQSTISSYNSNADLSSDLLNAIYNDPALRANAGAMFTNNRTRSEVKSGQGLATITSKINDQQTPSGLILNEVGRQTSSAIYARPDQFSGLGSLGGTQLDIIITYGDPNGMTNEFGVTSFMGSSSIVLRDVHFLGEAQQIMADDQPIMETYKFMARKKEVLIGTNVKMPVNLSEADAVKAAKAAEEVAKMVIEDGKDFAGNSKQKPTEPTAPVPAPVAAVEPEKPTIAPIPEQFGLELTEEEAKAMNVTPTPVNNVYPPVSPYQELEGETIYQNSVGVLSPNMLIDPTPRSKVPAVPGSPFSETGNEPAGTGTVPSPAPVDGVVLTPEEQEERALDSLGKTPEQRRAAAEAAANPSPAPVDAVPLTPEQMEDRAFEALGRTPEQRRAAAAAAESTAAPSPAPAGTAAPEEEVIGDRQKALEAEALARGAAKAAAATPTPAPANAAAPEEEVIGDRQRALEAEALARGAAKAAAPTPAPADTAAPSTVAPDPVNPTAPATENPDAFISPVPINTTPAVPGSAFSEVEDTTTLAPATNTTAPNPPATNAAPPEEEVVGDRQKALEAEALARGAAAAAAPTPAPTSPTPTNQNSPATEAPSTTANTPAATPAVTPPASVNTNPVLPFEEVEVPGSTSNSPPSTPAPTPTSSVNNTNPSPATPAAPPASNPSQSNTNNVPTTTTATPTPAPTSVPAQPATPAPQEEEQDGFSGFGRTSEQRRADLAAAEAAANPTSATPPATNPTQPASPVQVPSTAAPTPAPSNSVPITSEEMEDRTLEALGRTAAERRAAAEAAANPTPAPTANTQPTTASGGILPTTGTSNAPPATPQPTPPAPTEPSSPATPTVDKPTNPFEEL